MATEILESFGNLQQELEQARNTLKGVDENIKRLIGRDPSEIPPRPNVKRPSLNDDKARSSSKVVRRNFENEEPLNKRRNPGGVSVFKRLSDRPVYDNLQQNNPRQLISKVIVTPKEIPSRQEALEAQSKDVKYRERNRRMFGALLGTLQKFQQEETKLKKKEEKREKIEKKIEEHEIKEKEEIKKERQELFYNRRKKQAEIKMIELKMLRMREYATWEERQKPRKNFIMTKARPHIHFLPRRLNDSTKELLEKSKAEVEKVIEKKKHGVLEELKHIEDRMKRNFDAKFGSRNKEVQSEAQETGNHKRRHDNDDDDHSDEDGDAMMSELPLSGDNDNDESKEKIKEEAQDDNVEQNGDSEEKHAEDDSQKNETSTESKNEEQIEDASNENIDNVRHSPKEFQESTENENLSEEDKQSVNI